MISAVVDEDYTLVKHPVKRKRGKIHIALRSEIGWATLCGRGSADMVAITPEEVVEQERCHICVGVQTNGGPKTEDDEMETILTEARRASQAVGERVMVHWTTGIRGRTSPMIYTGEVLPTTTTGSFLRLRTDDGLIRMIHLTRVTHVQFMGSSHESNTNAQR